MRSSTLIPGLLGLAAAIPYDNAAGAGISSQNAPVSLNKRANSQSQAPPWWCPWIQAWVCQGTGLAFGPDVTPDTVDAFKKYTGFAQVANQAVAPSGYIQSFRNLDGATSTSNYLGYTELQKYDPATCAAKCDAQKGCLAFNVWFERDPSTTTDPFCCPNPGSVARIKCSWWGTYATSTTANNKGQYRDQFQVIMAGSNGYNKGNPPVSSSSAVSSSSVASSASVVRTSTSPSLVASSSARTSTQSSSASSASSVASRASSSSSAASSANSLASSSAKASSSASSGSGAVSGASSARNTVSTPASSGSGAGSVASPAPSSPSSSSQAAAGAISGASSTRTTASVLSGSDSGSLTSSSALSSGPTSQISGGAVLADAKGSSSAQGSASNTPSVTSAPSGASTTSSSATVNSSQASVAASQAELPNPEGGSPVTASVSSASSCATPTVANPELTFNLNRTISQGQSLWMYGSIPALGDVKNPDGSEYWNADPQPGYDPTSDAPHQDGYAVPLSVYKSSPNNWFAHVNVSSGTSFYYKYFQRNQDWSITWPPVDNKAYTVPSGCQQEIIVNDTWE